MINLFKMIMFIVCLNASAQDSEIESEAAEMATARACEFNIQCKKNNMNYLFEYKVLGDGCEDNTSGQLVLISNEKRVPLEIKGLPFKKFEDNGNTSKVCEVDGEKYPAVDIGENRIALFVRIDNRPSLDRLGALIVDLKKNRIVKLEPNLGEIKNVHFAMLKSGRGYKTRLVKEYLKEVSCDCDASVIDGWKEISVFTDIFKTKWIK